jgi:hypothetical protein
MNFKNLKFIFKILFLNFIFVNSELYQIERFFRGGRVTLTAAVDYEEVVQRSKLLGLYLDAANPYWLNYYMSFWISGVHISSLFNRRDKELKNSEICNTFSKKVVDVGQTFFDTVICNAKYENNSFIGAAISHHFRQRIGNEIPCIMNTGEPCYGSEIITLLFHLNEVKYIDLGKMKVGACLTLLPGEVTVDGFGIVPTDKEMTDWVFVTPIGSKEINFVDESDIFGCFLNDKYASIYDP